MSSKSQSPRKPTYKCARDYIVLKDGTRYEKGDKIPADVAKDLPASFLKEGK